MNINWKIVKVIIAVVVMLGASVLVINTIRPRYYEGANLEFPIAEGVVQVTNSSEELTVQLISSSSRTFRVSSPSEDISGASTRQDAGNNAAQIFEFVLPSGMSEFTVSGNTNVIFEATTDTNLDATVYPFGNEAIRVRIIGLLVLAFAILFYISHLYDHLWISATRRQDAKDDIAAQETEQDNFDRIMESRSSKRRP